MSVRPVFVTLAGMATSGQLSFADLEAADASCPVRPHRRRDATRATRDPVAPADRAAVAALEAALVDARARETTVRRSSSSQRALATRALSAVGSSGASAPDDTSIRWARDDWLRRLKRRGRARARLSLTGSRSTICSPGAASGPKRVRGGDDRRLSRRLPAARAAGAGDLLPPLRAPATLLPLAQPPRVASPTRSSSSSRRRSRSRKPTG